MKTIVTQIIPTVQGEGPSVGTPVLLIRLANCNLECNFCDTKWSNNIKPKDVKKFNSSQLLPALVDENNFDNFIEHIHKEFLSKYNITTILITGGEPLMNKEFITKVIFSNELKLAINKVEIETNGWLFEKNDFRNYDTMEKFIQFNISPKLDPEAYKSKKIKTVNDIIKGFIEIQKDSLYDILSKTFSSINWKFVYSKAAEADIDQFIEQVPMVNNIYIMPLTSDYTKYKSEMKFLEAFRASTYDALDYCMRKGYILTPRAHVWIFNNFKHRDEFIDVRNIKNCAVLEPKNAPKNKPNITIGVKDFNKAMKK